MTRLSEITRTGNDEARDVTFASDNDEKEVSR